MDKEKEYKVGDVVWYVAYSGIAIKCTITDVVDQFRKKYGSDGRLFYDLDEPIGHSVGANEVTDSRESVEEYFLSCSDEDFGNTRVSSLNEYRETTKRGVEASWGKDKLKWPGWPEYPDKNEGEDWFLFKAN